MKNQKVLQTVEKQLYLGKQTVFFEKQGKRPISIVSLKDAALVNFGLVIPTFDTKVTENLFSGWVFFLLTNFDFLTSHF